MRGSARVFDPPRLPVVPDSAALERASLARARAAARLRAAADADRLRARAAERVPARYSDARVDRPECRAWLDAYLSAASAPGRAAGPVPDLVLTGPAGAGKTRQLCALALALARAGCADMRIAARCLFEAGTLSSLIHRICADPAGGAPSDVAAAMAGVPVLFLDGVGEVAPLWAAPVVLGILAARRAHGRPVVATVDLPPAGLAAARGGDPAAAVSRLCGGAAVVIFDGPSRRVP